MYIHAQFRLWSLLPPFRRLLGALSTETWCHPRVLGGCVWNSLASVLAQLAKPGLLGQIGHKRIVGRCHTKYCRPDVVLQPHFPRDQPAQKQHALYCATLLAVCTQEQQLASWQV